MCATRKVMLSLLAWQSPTVFCKQNRDVCVRQQVDQFVIQSVAITLSHSLSHIHMYIFSCKHLLYNAVVLQAVLGNLLIYVAFASLFQQTFFWFINSFGLCGFKHNYASNRVLFDPCQFSLKPYVFSWHLYHIVILIQTQLSVCVCLWLCSRPWRNPCLAVSSSLACMFILLSWPHDPKVTMLTKASSGSQTHLDALCLAWVVVWVCERLATHVCV